MDDLQDPITRRQRLESLRSTLKRDRSSWIEHWREISENLQPRLGRFVVSDTNKGTKRHQKIHDNTGTLAARTLSAGLMAGQTSPARPWFKLELEDRDLMESADVKAWLFDVTTILRRIFSASNTYRALHSMYDELGLFGTAANLVVDDFNDVLHNHPYTIGEYAVAANEKGLVDTLVSERSLTVRQCVERFGLANCSNTIKDLWNRHSIYTPVTVVHVIRPRDKRDQSKLDSRNMAYESVYYEEGRDSAGFLGESGFRKLPLLAPRWDVTGNDVYGKSPGMECLGDVKQLQFQQLRKAQGIDYMVNPPLQVPTVYKEAENQRLPGGVMFVDQVSPGGGVRTAFEVNLNLNHLLEDIQDIRARVRSGFFADLFLMLANAPADGRMTATEVAERHEEKLLMLGPVLERQHNELLSPLIDIAFDKAARAGILPPPPPETQGMDLKVEFISVLAQAQRAVGAQSTDRMLGTIASMAQLWPEVRHKVNALQAVDEYAEMYGVPPRIIVPDDQAQAAIEADARAAQAAQAAAMAKPVADAAKATGEIDVDNTQQVLTQFMGYDSPSPQEVA